MGGSGGARPFATVTASIAATVRAGAFPFGAHPGTYQCAGTSAAFARVPLTVREAPFSALGSPNSQREGTASRSVQGGRPHQLSTRTAQHSACVRDPRSGMRYAPGRGSTATPTAGSRMRGICATVTRGSHDGLP